MPEEIILTSPSTLTVLQYVHFGFAAEATERSQEKCAAVGWSYFECSPTKSILELMQLRKTSSFPDSKRPFRLLKTKATCCHTP
jgi:hypothetical protein